MEPLIITFDPTNFRLLFPVFADPTVYPDVRLQMYWDQAINFISDENYGFLTLLPRTLALNLLTAHLLQLSTIIKAGQVPNLVQGSTIDKISVTLTPPKIPNQWQWWLNQTGYGQELLALLQANSVGGFYAAGSPQTSAFRNVGGTFGVNGRYIWR